MRPNKEFQLFPTSIKLRTLLHLLQFEFVCWSDILNNFELLKSSNVVFLVVFSVKILKRFFPRKT